MNKSLETKLQFMAYAKDLTLHDTSKLIRVGKQKRPVRKVAITAVPHEGKAKTFHFHEHQLSEMFSAVRLALTIGLNDVVSKLEDEELALSLALLDSKLFAAAVETAMEKRSAHARATWRWGRVYQVLQGANALLSQPNG